MASNRIELAGCTPEPLMSYLKALGVLRLISDQPDPAARGFWADDLFALNTALSREEVSIYFLERYPPTPILGPWAGGSGFFGRDNRDAVEAITVSAEDRMAPYRAAIAQIQRILREEALAEKPSGEEKARLLRRYRREMPDAFVRWMDASMALGVGNEWYAPVLGTGGNDGRLDFTQNFMQRVVELGLHQQRPKKAAAALLQSALWGDPTAGLGKSAVGQFSPGRAGGPNATQGMEAGSIDNPWDFLLALEGALVLSSAAVRRLGVNAAGRGAFPFTVAARPGGDAEGSDDEAMDSRGELWLPLWERPASLAEIQTLFAEGRAEVGGRAARDAVDFSRAVAGLGTDRGVAAFSRYALLKRSGKAYLAVATERFHVPAAPPSGLDLVAECDRWRENLQSRVRSDGPARLHAVARRIESRIFAYAKYGDRADLLELLIALGAAEKALATTGGKRGDKVISRPLHDLSGRWISETDDGTLEFEIARAIAGLCQGDRGDGERSEPDLRANLEPVKRAKRGWTWDENAPTVVWRAGGLLPNLTAVLSRRLLDGGKDALASNQGVRLSTIARFLAGETDDRRIEELIWALSLVRPAPLRRPPDLGAPPLQRELALLKAMYLPWPVEYRGSPGRWSYRRGVEPVKIEPRILPLLRAGRDRDACTLARQRLLVSGMPPLLGLGEMGGGVPAERLAAALLLPVREEDLNEMLGLVCRPPILELQGKED